MMVSAVFHTTMELSDEFFEWISVHKEDNPSTLRLKYLRKNDGKEINYAFAILQIECRRKCTRKLSQTLSEFHHFIFPTILSAEQCTSDLLATFHSSLIPVEAETGIDLTSGLGIDAFHFSRKGLKMVAIEKENDIADALIYNSKGLHLDDFIVENDECENVIARLVEGGKHFDIGFIDPARRGDEGQRLYALKDCRPNVVCLLPNLSRLCDILMIKVSPMLDITQTIRDLNTSSLQKMVCIGTSTECKELLAVVDFRKECVFPKIECVSLFPNNEKNVFSFTMKEEYEAPALRSTKDVCEGMYLYDVYPAVMKSGAHKVIAQRFELNGFDSNTRLYYSDDEKFNFPGNIFKVIEVVDYSSKYIKRFASKYPSVSISCRNFGVKADILKKKLGVREGDGLLRLFAIKDSSKRQIMIVCKAQNVK